MITRRGVLAGGAAAISALAMPAIVRAATPLTLWAPPATPSILLAMAAADAGLQQVLPGTNFQLWRNPDEMRAGLASGTMSAIALPPQVAAIFRNRGMDIALVGNLTRGMLYVVSGDAAVAKVADLKGKRIACPFRNDLPDRILQALLADAGLAAGADVTVEYVSAPPEAVQMLMGGRVDAALVPEPAATGAIGAGMQAGKPVRRAIDVQAAWSALSGVDGIPGPCLAVTGALEAAAGGDAAAQIQSAVERALARLKADPKAAAAEGARLFDMPAPAVEMALAHSNLVAARASAARPSVEALLSVLAEADPASIGGKLPDDGFYAL